MLSFSYVTQGINFPTVSIFDEDGEKVGSIEKFPFMGWVLYLDLSTTLKDTEQIVEKMKELEKERA